MTELQLHDYQEVARDHLQRHPRSALFLDMGLGKTAATLRALTPDDLPALVIAPKRVAESTWPTETRKWRPDLSAVCAKGSPADRARILASDADIISIGRDNIRDVLAVKRGRGRGFKTVVLDELSSFKHGGRRGSIRSKAARKIIARESVEKVWGLTGTPSPNGLMDLWGQLYLLDGGERLGRTLTAFRTRWFTPGRQLDNGVITEWHPRPEAEAEIYAAIEDICLSMKTDGRIVLPDLTYNRIELDLPPAVRRLYRQFKRDLVVDLEVLGGEVHTAKNAASLTNRLSQMTAGFLYVDDADLRDRAYTELHRAKMVALQEVVEGANGSPVMVFYAYEAERQMIFDTLGDLAHGPDEPDMVDRWNAGDIPVLVAHPESIGHGLNLQDGGHIAVWTSLTWNLEHWLQANKRLYRQGQLNPVIIHILEITNSVDQVKWASLTDKDALQDALMTHLESPL